MSQFVKFIGKDVAEFQNIPSDKKKHREFEAFADNFRVIKPQEKFIKIVAEQVCIVQPSNWNEATIATHGA